MAITSKIAQLGANILRQQAQAVGDARSGDVRQIIANMRATLESTEGVGLAAPQISESKRIIIVASRPTPRYPSAPLMEPTVMINPEFQALSDKQVKDWEGCLSIPGIRALVPRFTKIKIQYTDEQGSFIEAELEGFVARVFQHEADHLDGKVYLDRVENNNDIISETAYLNLFKT
jgi:peptide deformylase